MKIISSSHKRAGFFAGVASLVQGSSGVANKQKTKSHNQKALKYFCIWPVNLKRRLGIRCGYQKPPPLDFLVLSQFVSRTFDSGFGSDFSQKELLSKPLDHETAAQIKKYAHLRRMRQVVKETLSELDSINKVCRSWHKA